MGHVFNLIGPPLAREDAQGYGVRRFTNLYSHTSIVQLLCYQGFSPRLESRHVRAGALAFMTLGGALESELLCGRGLPPIGCPQPRPYVRPHLCPYGTRARTPLLFSWRRRPVGLARSPRGIGCSEYSDPRARDPPEGGNVPKPVIPPMVHTSSISCDAPLTEKCVEL